MNMSTQCSLVFIEERADICDCSSHGSEQHVFDTHSSDETALRHIKSARNNIPKDSFQVSRYLQ